VKELTAHRLYVISAPAVVAELAETASGVNAPGAALDWRSSG
jgi:hypothetical protein